MNRYHFVKTALLALLIIVPGLKATDSPVPIGQLRPFTVADSIQMTHILDPHEQSIDHPNVSPDGTRFIVVTEKGMLERNTRQFTLLVYDLRDLKKPPTTLATFESSSNDPGIHQARWLDSEDISLIGENLGEQSQVYAVNLRTKRIQKLTNSISGVGSYVVTRNRSRVIYYDQWILPRKIAQSKEEHGFAVGEEYLTDLVIDHGLKAPTHTFVLYVEDLRTHHRLEINQRPFHFTGGGPSILLSPDNRYAVMEQPAPDVPKLWESYTDEMLKYRAHEWAERSLEITPWGIGQIMLLDLETGKIRPLIDAPVSTHMGSSTVWMSDSRSVVVAGTMLPLSAVEPGELERRKRNPVITAVDILTGNTKLISEIHEDEAAVGVAPGPEPDTFITQGYKVEGGDYTDRLPEKFFRRAGIDWIEDQQHKPNLQPGSDIKIKQSLNDWPVLVRVDPVTQRETLILDPNPQFKTMRFGRRETINWTGKRGEALMGGLVYPVDFVSGKRYPLVIQTHGYYPDMFLLDGPFTTALAAEELANRGMFVLQMGGGPLYRKSHDTLDFGPVQLSMFESAIDHLDRQGYINRDAVGLVGFSITGFAVRYALEYSTYHIAAATSAEGNDYGYFSYIAFANEGSWAAQVETPYGGPPWKGNWKSWMQSLSFNFDRIHTPLRLESDSNDYGTVINEWENFMAMKRLNKPVELIYLSHGAHPVVKPWDRMTSQQGNVDWLLFWLKGEEDPDPSKADQYTRWRELRKLQEHSDGKPKAQVGH